MVFAFECFCFFTKSPGKLWPNFLVILFKYFVSLFSGQIALEIVVSVTKLRKTNIRGGGRNVDDQNVDRPKIS
jgi:hypothetical protein